MTESYRKAFDALGIDKVRRFANNPSSTGEKLEQALFWIGEKEAEQQRAFMTRIEARMAEQIDIARSTKSAAQIAAILAAIAAIISIVALFK
jgi:hypothetical protein